MEVPRDSESEEEIHWFKKLQKPDLKSDCLVEKSITSSSSHASNPAAVARITGIDKHDCLVEDSLQGFSTMRFSC